MLALLIGAVVGAWMFAAADGDWFTGALAGALVVLVSRVNSLARQIAELRLQVALRSAAPDAAAPAAVPPREPVRSAPEPQPELEPVFAKAEEEPEPVPAAPPPAPRFPPPPREPTPADRVFAAVKEYFTTGNPVARVGSVVLFFGLAFLLKYAADRDIIPIQLRLAGVAAGGIALLVLGWRLRHRGVYGAVLQGTGIGTLYLTTYVALRPYALIPPLAASVILVAVVVLSGWLALLQDARALATLGTLGGFLAPILTSTGEGSHVLYFSYYALLNLGILWLAWRRTWRELNVMGFVFTFVVASIWGYQAYQPRHYATTQPFLAFFWALYLAIPVLFASRRRTQGIGYLDGTLVFGVPTAAFALQAAIAADLEQGLTVSALVAAAVYLAAARLLQLRAGEALLPVRQSFTALGVAFATLAVPLAFDGSWLAATWALEGAALVWVGTKQNGRLARASGIALQVFATAGMASSGDEPISLAVLNGPFLSAVVIAVTGVMSAYFLTRRKDAPATPWTTIAPFALAWGMGWWLWAGVMEIGRRAPGGMVPHLIVLFLALSAVAIDRIGRRLDWEMAGLASAGLLPLLGVMALAGLQTPERAILLAPWGAAAWLVAAAAHLLLLRWREKDWPQPAPGLWHAAGLLLALLLLARDSAWGVQHLLGARGAWVTAAWVVIPTLALLLLPLGRRSGWPLGDRAAEYSGVGIAPAAAALAVWAAAVTFQAQPAAPLRYLPLLHPFELAQAAILLALWRWWAGVRGEPPFSLLRPWHAPAALGVLAFLAINGVLARSVHVFGDVPFTSGALFGNRTFHAGLSILWSTLAMGIMLAGSRRRIAPLWFGGSGLLGLVVVKLFLVELSGSGTVARIVSFVAVGLLMLLIGYLAPMPPREEEPAVAVAGPPAG